MFGLIDCNNFFVSCERLFRPDLQTKPVLVASSKGGVIVARSEEAKKLGIPMAVPVFQVTDIIKEHNVTIFSPNFELYRDISRRVMGVLKEELDAVYQYSVDEAFFVLDQKPKDELVQTLKHLKIRIEMGIGVPVSLGTGRTMTIAKYASELKKRKEGICVLLDSDWLNLASKVMLSDIWGIGGATAKKLRERNLHTVEDFIKTDRHFIKKIFGINGENLYSELSGIPSKNIMNRDLLPKTIMSTRSFEKTTDSLSFLERSLSGHVDKVSRELRDKKASCHTLRVIIGTSRHGDWLLHGDSKKKLMDLPTNDTRTILRYSIDMLRQMYKPNVPYKKIGLIVGEIIPTSFMQRDLFTIQEDNDEANILMTTLDQINDRFGKNTLLVGSLPNNKLYNNNYSPRYTTSWDDLFTLK